MSCLNDLLISKVRVKVLELFFKNPEEIYYVREITRLVKEEINAVRRELERMLECGLLKSEQRANRLYYYLNKNYLYYQELQRIVAKSTGLGKKIRRYRRKLGTLSFVVFSGTFIAHQTPRPDELDIIFVGDVVLPELEQLIKAEQVELGREINYAVLSADEFEFRKTRRDPFVMEFLYAVRAMIIGEENEFVQRNLPIN